MAGSACPRTLASFAPSWTRTPGAICYRWADSARPATWLPSSALSPRHWRGERVHLDSSAGRGKTAAMPRVAACSLRPSSIGMTMTWAAFRRQLAPFIAHARKTGRGPRRGPGRSASSRERSADIRAWAKDQGIAVSERGPDPRKRRCAVRSRHLRILAQAGTRPAQTDPPRWSLVRRPAAACG
jgi:hypothetical protein